jgi:hypothetical protein
VPLVLNGTTGVQDNSGAFVRGTAVASTSGTSIDFTSIPSWVKRVTVLFNGVSTSGTANLLIQIGSGSFQSSGYISNATSSAPAGSTAGFLITASNAAAYTSVGVIQIVTLGSNLWSENGNIAPNAGTNSVSNSAGAVTLSGTLDRVRITTVGGTNTFDAGSINILYE